MTIKIAQLSCGTEYSGIQSQIEHEQALSVAKWDTRM